MTLIDDLNNLYVQAMDTDSPEDFYHSVINYIKLANNKKEISNWLKKEQKEYEITKEDIIELDKSYDEEVARLSALDRNSVGNWYKTLNDVVVYIYDSLESERQDPSSDLNKETLRNRSIWKKLKKKEERFKALFKKLHQAMLVHAKDEKVFMFKEATGSFTYNGVSGKLNPNTREYNVFKKLYREKSEPVSYGELISAMNPQRKETQSSKNDLRQVINSIKRKFGILPDSQTSNKDIFKNVRNSGYKLQIPDN